MLDGGLQKRGQVQSALGSFSRERARLLKALPMRAAALFDATYVSVLWFHRLGRGGITKPIIVQCQFKTRVLLHESFHNLRYKLLTKLDSAM